MYHHWTAVEIDFLRENYSTSSKRHCEDYLHLTWSQIKSKASDLRIPRKFYGKAGRYSRWTPKTDISPVDLAYIAGFVDGEGCLSIEVSFYKESGKFRTYPAIDISNTNKEVLTWISETIGQPIEGSLKIRQRIKTTQKPGWDLRIRGQKQMICFLAQIIPFLRVKKTQAILMLEMLQKHLPSESPEAILYSIKIREANDSYRQSNIDDLARVKKIFNQLVSHTSN